jgi:hypothetical protein
MPHSPQTDFKPGDEVHIDRSYFADEGISSRDLPRFRWKVINQEQDIITIEYNHNLGRPRYLLITIEKSYLRKGPHDIPKRS